MTKVSYALREDPSTLFLLQDAGKTYSKFCQIAVFGKSVVKPEYLRQHLALVPCSSDGGKYHGTISKVHMSMDDNEHVPDSNYVAIIDSEFEFVIKPSVILQLCQDHMPAWELKSYLDYFGDRRSGIILLLKVYKANVSVPSEYIQRGIKTSKQIFKLYDRNNEETSYRIDSLEQVISNNKFQYLKEEILHILRVEDALISVFDNTEKGLNFLQDRIIADRQLKGITGRWLGSGHIDYDDDDDDDADMAQLDYEIVFREAVKSAPQIRDFIEYVKKIKPARLGEYDYYLKDVHEHNEKEDKSAERLFEMSVRSAVKTALYYHKRTGLEFEDILQTACIGIIYAIQKHNDNVEGLFPSYVSLWMKQIIARYLPQYGQGIHVSAYFNENIEQLLRKLLNEVGYMEQATRFDAPFDTVEFDELYDLLIQNTDCEDEEAFCISALLTPMLSIESITDLLEYVEEQAENADAIPLNNYGSLFDCELYENNDSLRGDSDLIYKNLSFLSYDGEMELIDEVNLSLMQEQVWDVLDTLTPREEKVLRLRFGFDNGHQRTLEEVGKIFNVTRERIRQIEAKAIRKLRHPSRSKKLKGYVVTMRSQEKKESKCTLLDDIDQYIPQNVTLTNTQREYLTAVVDLIKQKEVVKMSDVSKYLNKAIGTTGYAMKKLSSKGILFVNSNGIITLLNTDIS